MSDDYQKTLGNFGAKNRISFEGTDYVFEFPGAEVVSDMERLCKDEARKILLDSKSYLTAEDYAQEAREHKHRLDTGYYSAPNGEGFKTKFNVGGGKIETLFDLCECLLRPNHPNIKRSEVTRLVGRNMEEVVLILQEILPTDAQEPEASASPKANAAG